MIEFNLHVLLAKKRMSQQELSNISNVSRSTINRIATGKTNRIDIDTLDSICLALDCSICDILIFKREEL